LHAIAPGLASVETVNRATEVRLLAERQMGDFLKAMPKNEGAKGLGKSAVVDDNHTPTLREIGVSKDQSARAQKLASIPEQEFRGRIEAVKANRHKKTPPFGRARERQVACFHSSPS
jgi:hypothetical protein